MHNDVLPAFWSFRSDQMGAARVYLESLCMHCKQTRRIMNTLRGWFENTETMTVTLCVLLTWFWWNEISVYENWLFYRDTVMQDLNPESRSSAENTGATRHQAYLPGTEDTVIHEAVPPVWGPSIALRLGWPLRSPQMWVTRVRNFC